MKIDIAKDFSDTPWGRYPDDGDFCGEIFRKKFLLPNLKNASVSDPLIIKIDGAEGFGSSFLEEAFGGLVRLDKIDPAKLKSIIKIENEKSSFQMYVKLIWKYIEEAASQE